MSGGHSLSRALREDVGSLTEVSDPTLPLQIWKDRPALAGTAYATSIVEWTEHEGRRLPYLDLARPGRERLLHFLDRPGRAMLWEHALTFPRRPERGTRNDAPFAVFYVEPDDETELELSLLAGPIIDERDAQRALTSGNPTWQPWRHVGALLDGVQDGELPENGDVVDDARIRTLVRRAVGLVLSIGDDGHVFFWGRSCAHMGVPDRTRTEAHATELAWWWREEEGRPA